MTLQTFFSMGGYGTYIWSAYGSVLVLLTLQWVYAWRRFKASLQRRSITSTDEPTQDTAAPIFVMNNDPSL